MIIAVNTRLNKEMQPEGYEAFLFSMLDNLATRFPQHQFLYIFDEPYHGNSIFRKNVLPVVAGPKTSSSLRLQYWFNYKIPTVLRKYHADVFVSLEGICSLRSKVPQCLLVSYLGFLQHSLPVKKKQDRFYKKNTAAFLAKARSIATISGPSKKMICDHYKIPAANVTVIHPPVEKIFIRSEWEEQEITRAKYTGGISYFLCGTNSNLINLLKAFTFFKKRQKSSMLLLIAGNTDEDFKKEFKTYKLRGEVKLLDGLDKTELAKITAAAYTVIHPVLYDDIALPALQALQCQVPLVISERGSLPSVFGDAALYINPENYEDIAQQMMLVFKDENKASELVQAGNKLIQEYQLNKNADLLMDCILNAANR